MGLVSGKIQKLMGNIKGFFKGGGGPSAGVVSSMMQKSPLDVNDNPAVSHMKHDPYSFGFTQYPTSLGATDEGHYMIFIAIRQKNKVEERREHGTSHMGVPTEKTVNQSTASKNFINKMDAMDAGGVGEGNVMELRGQESGVAGKVMQTHNIAESAVFLYTPPSIKTSYGINYANVEMGFLGTALKGGKSALKDFSLANLGSLAGGAIKDIFKRLGAMILGEGGKAGFQKAFGTAINPHMEVIFESVPMREFTFEYTFSPNDDKELQSTHKILRFFKEYMHPGFQSADTEAQFILPEQFEIRYMYKDKENMYLPKISRCVLAGMDLDYTPNEAFTTFKADGFGASPNIIKMTLTFKELEIMTKATIAPADAPNNYLGGM